MPLNKIICLALIIGLILLLGIQQSYAQDINDIKISKILTKVNYWECIELKDLTQGVAPRAILGTVIMQFYVLKEKKLIKFKDKKGREKEKRITEVSSVFKLELAGKERTLNFVVKNNSIVLLDSEDWGNYKIIRVQKNKVVLEHELDNHNFRWTMLPLPKDRRPIKR